MLGAGIYALIGKAAGAVGNAVWLSFIVALVAALLTALSYASLGSRYPVAGGAAYVVDRAFGFPILSFTVGLALVCSALTSVATQSQVFGEVLIQLTGLARLPVWSVAVGFIAILGAIVFRGIRESMWVNVACTLVEAGGLLLVIAVGFGSWGNVDYFHSPAGSALDFGLLVVQGASLTFFAFIGFEDTINVAEECRDPARTIPIGLVLATTIAAVLYMGVAVSAVSVVPSGELAAAASPLTEVVSRAAPMIPAVLLTTITLFAVANTALVNYITASRQIYGMAKQGLLPLRLSHVHRRTQTPHIAIVVIAIVLVPLALAGSIADLASATVLLLLTVFTIVNGALVVLKHRRSETPGRFEIPIAIPIGGACVCATLVIVRVSAGDWYAPAIAGGLLVLIIASYAVLRANTAKSVIRAATT